MLIKITNYCSMGCSHFSGGEATEHPDVLWFLETARSRSYKVNLRVPPRGQFLDLFDHT